MSLSACVQCCCCPMEAGRPLLEVHAILLYFSLFSGRKLLDLFVLGPFIMMPVAPVHGQAQLMLYFFLAILFLTLIAYSN